MGTTGKAEEGRVKRQKHDHVVEVASSSTDAKVVKPDTKGPPPKKIKTTEAVEGKIDNKKKEQPKDEKIDGPAGGFNTETGKTEKKDKKSKKEKKEKDEKAQKEDKKDDLEKVHPKEGKTCAGPVSEKEKTAKDEKVRPKEGKTDVPDADGSNTETGKTEKKDKKSKKEKKEKDEKAQKEDKKDDLEKVHPKEGKTCDGPVSEKEKTAKDEKAQKEDKKDDLEKVHSKDEKIDGPAADGSTTETGKTEKKDKKSKKEKKEKDETAQKEDKKDEKVRPKEGKTDVPDADGSNTETGKTEKKDKKSKKEKKEKDEKAQKEDKKDDLEKVHPKEGKTCDGPVSEKEKTAKDEKVQKEDKKDEKVRPKEGKTDVPHADGSNTETGKTEKKDKKSRKEKKEKDEKAQKEDKKDDLEKVHPKEGKTCDGPVSEKEKTAKDDEGTEGRQEGWSREGAFQRWKDWWTSCWWFHHWNWQDREEGQKVKEGEKRKGWDGTEGRQEGWEGAAQRGNDKCWTSYWGSHLWKCQEGEEGQEVKEGETRKGWDGTEGRRQEGWEGTSQRGKGWQYREEGQEVKEGEKREKWWIQYSQDEVSTERFPAFPIREWHVWPQRGFHYGGFSKPWIVCRGGWETSFGSRGTLPREETTEVWQWWWGLGGDCFSWCLFMH